MELTSTDLERIINGLDGKPNSSYRELQGTYRYENFMLIVEYIPDAPHLSPARLRARMSLEAARFPRDVFEPRSREIAARDFLARTFNNQAIRASRKKGPRSARIGIDRPGQQMLETSAVVVGGGFIEVRFTVDLPIAGRKIPALDVLEVFLKSIPQIVNNSLRFDRIDGNRLAVWLDTAEDADTLRGMLPKLGLVAFVGDRSALVKRNDDAKSFSAPDDLAVMVDLPNRGKVRGMGIPKGLTVIAGGGGAGKSTLLHAIEQGVYNHVPGDGRELVVTVPDAVGVRTEEGRKVSCVDLSPFFQRMIQKIDPQGYSTGAATAAVSQAAGIMEAIDIGTSLLTLDEDTTAASLISRDQKMQELVPTDDEPFRTFLDILPVLRDQANTSTIIVLSGCGSYLDIADTVIVMKNYKGYAATDTAKQIVAQDPCRRVSETVARIDTRGRRCPLSQTLEPPRIEKIGLNPRGRGLVQYGDEFIDLSKVTQLVNQSQARGISRGIAMVHRLMDSSSSLREAINKVIQRVDQIGLDALSSRKMGDLATFRPQELVAAINRLKQLQIK